jgi:hypothetical protein
MLFAPILGTNHQKQTIIFRVALLFDESIPFFIWLFQTFLEAMSGKHPSTIFTDQDEAIAGVIAYVFPNTRHCLCLWHIYLNASKHLGCIIQDHPEKFIPVFKSCVYEDRSEFQFDKKWHELWQDYNLGENGWMKILYSLRKKRVIVFCDSFTFDMTSTQRSEGMNNVYEKRFWQKFSIFELLVECDKVFASLRANELDEDFHSRQKVRVPYIPILPMLKTASESYIRRIYSEFEAEFKDHFLFSGTVLKIEGSISTYIVTHMQSDHGATFIFNVENTTITCSYRKYESIGMYTYFGS